MIGRSKAWLVGVSLLSGCAIAVTAQGYVAPGPDGRPWISASNGKAYVLADGRAAEAMRHLDGDLVSLEGRLVKQEVVVDQWTILQGKLGFSAFTGVVESDGRTWYIREPSTGQRIALTGEGAREVTRFPGKLMLVEGVVDGPMSVRVLRSVLLEDGP